MRPIGPRSLALLPLVAILTLAPTLAQAQPAEPAIYADEPTGGLRLPSFGISGEGDATQTVLNPAGLQFLPGPTLGLVIDAADEDEVTTVGQGVGLYLGTALGGKLLPKTGLGLGFEFLEPSRRALDPDPGSPKRLSLSSSMALGPSASFGLLYQRYWDEPRPIDGLGSWTAGLAARFGAHFGAGAVVRDLTAPTVASTPVQRRYELELVSRPLGTDRLEVAAGGRVGEVRGDLDGWMRWSARIARGLYFRGQASVNELNRLTVSPTSGSASESTHEWRFSAGFEMSFSGLTAVALASGAIDPNDNSSFRGGTLAFSASPVQKTSIFGEDRRIERIELKGGIDDRKLTALVARMKNIERDPKVVGVLIQLDSTAGGWATFQEIRHRVLALRLAGKKVIAHIVAGNTAQYFVASAADKVFVDPAGGIRLVGYGATSLYLRKVFDMLGVKAQFVKIDEYKSAPEQFTRSGPSEPAWRQRNELMDSLYAQFLAGVTSSRNIELEELKEVVNHGPYTAGDLKKMPKLVDAVAEPEELEKIVHEVFGGKYPVRPKPLRPSERWSYPKIAIVYLSGDIVGGKSRRVPLLGRKLVGGETIAGAIAAARANPAVRAIVLRIDSPGGSALASEVISREVFRTRGKKPIICSMGDIAASGGYFAAAGCDTIFAEPMTITGSIGIFNGTFDISGLMRRLGVTWVTYSRGDNVALESMFRSWTDDDRKLLTEKIRYFYNRFLDAVAKGRGMTREEVDKVGRGRVWTGAQAKKVGLIDEFGGLYDAIALAKERAGMSETTRVELVPLPSEDKSLLSKLGINVPGAEAAQPQIVLPIPGGEKILEALPASLWAEPTVPQARLPFSIIWH